MVVGKRLFFDKVTGEIILDVQPQSGTVATVERNIEQFSILSERNRETFDVLELPYGAYANDFREGTLIGVDLETRVPKFDYSTDPSEPIIPLVPLSVQVDELKEKQVLSNQLVADNSLAQQELLELLIDMGVI